MWKIVRLFLFSWQEDRCRGHWVITSCWRCTSNWSGCHRQKSGVRLGQMIYHFLAYAVDIECSNVTDELLGLLKDILSPDERQKIKKLKRADAMVKSLLMMMREKSAAQFESFLTTLSETGQQSVVDVVRLVLCRVGQTEHNPLRYAPGTTEENVFRGMQQWPITGIKL